MSSPHTICADPDFITGHTRSRSMMTALPPPIPAKPRTMSTSLHVNTLSPNNSQNTPSPVVIPSRVRENSSSELLPVMTSTPSALSMRERLHNFMSKKSTISSPTMGDFVNHPSFWVGKVDHRVEDQYVQVEHGLKTQKKVGSLLERVSQISVRYAEKIQSELRQEGELGDEVSNDAQAPVRMLYKQLLKTVEEYGKSLESFGQNLASHVSTPQLESYKQSEALRKMNQSELMKEMSEYKKIQDQQVKQESKCRQVWEGLGEQEASTFKMQAVLHSMDDSNNSNNSSNGGNFMLDSSKTKEKLLVSQRKLEKNLHEQVDRTGKEFVRYEGDIDKAISSHEGLFLRTRPLCVQLQEALERSRIDRIRTGALRFSETLQKLSEQTWHVAELAQQAEALRGSTLTEQFGRTLETNKGTYNLPAAPASATPLPAQTILDAQWHQFVDKPFGAPAHSLFHCKNGSAQPGMLQLGENSYLLVSSVQGKTCTGTTLVPSLTSQPSSKGVAPLSDVEHVRWSEQPPLALVLTTPDACALFQAHLRTEYSEENLLFWKRAVAFRVAYHTELPANQQLMKHDATDILQTFVLSSATTQVNLKADVLRELETVASEKTESPDMFVRAEREIYHLLSNDSFARFKKSEAFTKYLIAKRV